MARNKKNRKTRKLLQEAITCFQSGIHENKRLKATFTFSEDDGSTILNILERVDQRLAPKQ